MLIMSRLFALVAVAAAFIPAAPAAAITNGSPDDGRNPYVGGLVSHDPETGERYLICAGTLISRTVFLTAAHCLVDEPERLEVSFDTFIGAPDVGPGVKLHAGRAIGHPDFEDETAPGDTHDIAVVVLDDPVRGVRTAKLPPVGTLDKLDRAEVLDDFRYRVAGFGREGRDEEGFFGGGSRRFAFSAFRSLEPAKLLLDQTGTTGGTCRGDSGGPVLLGRTRTVVGITSDGDPDCADHGVYYRVDTRSAQAFLRRFVK